MTANQPAIATGSAAAAVDAIENRTAGVSTRSIIGPSVVLGFATAITMWLVWLIGHQPWLDLPASIAGPGMGRCV